MGLQDTLFKAGSDYLQKQLHENDNNNTASVTGGEHLNRPGGNSVGDGQQAAAFDHGVNLDAAAQEAQKHTGGDSSLFDTALSFMKNTNATEPVDEAAATKAHDQAYSQGNTSGMSASSLGTAAALQAFKQFTSGSSSTQSSSGGDVQSKLISMAMSEAMKLFEKFGGNVQGNKEDAVSSAGSTMLKLLVQSKLSGGGASGIIGGGNSGGLGQLMNVASTFLK